MILEWKVLYEEDTHHFLLINDLDKHDTEPYMIEMQIHDVSIMALVLEVDDRECLVGAVQVSHT